MANTSSAKKAIRQTTARTARNQAVRQGLRSKLKEVLAKSRDLSLGYKTIDKAAKRRVLSRARARRLKSKLARALSSEKKSSESRARS